MSTTVEERVVSMEFDNRHFESNVKTSLGTIDRLKESLNFNGAFKGLENVNNAAKNVDMNSLGSGIEAVKLKFSALEVMAVTALSNITNSAVNAGKRIISSLTLDPIKMGFSEYETKINAIQTIMSNTASKGTTMADVTRVIDELNTYADKTIYNFAEMTKNIGTFTAAGVGLEDSAAAIQGIANLAAASGSNSQKASTAMYQLSQALAAGYVKLMDWNSVVNAGMGGEKFQNALKQTAKEMGIAVDDIIKKHGSFRESLSEGWITAEVLNTTLRKFTTEGAAEYADAMVKAGKYTKEQADALKREAAAMEDAATKVKTFTQLWDTLKESLQSGWGKTWELIIGNFEQAKESLTSISDLLTGENSFLTKSADMRNNFIESVLGSNWDKFIARLEEAGVAADEFDKVFRDTLEIHNYDVDKLIDKFGSLEAAVRKGGISTYVLEKAIGNLNKTAKKATDISKVTVGMHFGDASEGVKQLQEALISLGYDLSEFGADGKYGKETAHAVMAFQKASGLRLDSWITKDTLAALQKATASTEEIAVENKVAVESFSDLIAIMQEASGRELLMDSLKNTLEAVLKVLSSVSDAFRKVFSIKPTQVLNFIKALNEFTKKLILSDENAEKLRRTLEGLFSIVKILTTIAGGGLKIAFKVLSALFGNLDSSILDLTASVGDVLVAFKDNVEDLVNAVTDFVVDGIDTWIAKFKETELFKTVAGYFDDASEKMSEAITNITEKLKEFEVDTVIDKLKTFGSFVSDIAGKITHSEIFISIVDGICAAFAKLTEFAKKIKLPEFNIDNLLSFSKMASIFDGLGVISLSNAVTELGNYFKGINQFKWETFKNNALQKFVTFWLKTGDFMKVAFEKCKEVALAITKFLFGTEEINLPVIMDAVTKFLGIIVLIKTIKMMSDIVSPLDNITDAINNFASSRKWKNIGDSFKAMALALVAFTACIYIISNHMDFKSAVKSALLLAGLMVVMGGVIAGIAFVVGKLDKGLDAAAAATALLMVIGAILMLVQTLKMIDELELEHPGKTFLTLAAILVALTAGVKMIAKAGGSSFKSVAAILTLMAALKLVLEVIEAYDKYDWTGKSDAIKKMIGMMLALSVAINISSRGAKAGASSSGLALLLLAMVFSLKILLDVMKEFADMDTNTLVKGGLAVVALLGVMTWMMVEINAASQGTVLQKGERSVNSFKGLAVALLAVVASIWLLGKMDFDTLKQGAIATTGILILFTGMLAAVGASCQGLKIGSIITLMFMIGLLMAEMAGIINYMRDIPIKQSLGSAGALAGLLLAISVAVRSIKAADVKIGTLFKWIGAMTAMAGVLAILAFVLLQIKDVNPVNSIGNVVALSALLYAMSGVLIVLTKHRNGAKSIYKWIGAMAVLSLVMAELAIVLRLVKDVNPANSIGNVVALSALMLAMTGVLTILTKHRNGAKSIYKWIGAMATLGLVVAELALILRLVKDINPANAIGNVIALSVLMIALSGVLGILKLIKFNNKDFTSIVGLATVALSLAILVEVLRNMQGIEDARENAITLALLAGALSLCMIPLGAVGKLAGGGAIVGAIAVAALMASLFIVVEVLRNMQGIEDARDNAITLAILAGVLSLCIIPLAIAGSLAAGALVGVGSLALLMASLFIVVGVLATMQNVSNAKENAVILAGLAAVLTLLLIPLTLVGALGGFALAGVGLLAAMMVSLFVVVGVLAAMQGIKNAQANANILIELLNAMTSVLVVVSLLAPMSLVGVGALSALLGIVTKLGVFVVAVGALTEWIPDIEDFLDKGLEVFKKLAGGLGEIISAFMLGATSDLPEIGDTLSKFMENAQPFITSIGSVGDDVGTGAKNLTSAMLGLLAADFVAGLASLCDLSLADLGRDLSEFADEASAFIEAMNGIDANAATGVSAFCTAINALVAANLKDAWTQILPGDNSLSSFGENISAFAECIKSASESLKNISDDDVANIERSAKAGMALAELNKAIPAQGGIAQDLLGSKELGEWGLSIDAFADCLISYSNKVSGDAIDAGAITASAEAAGAIADLNGKIPAKGGWADDILGSNDIAIWGQSIDAFADSLVSYSSKVSGANIDPEAITRSAEAASAVAELNGKLPGQNGLFQDVMGSQDLSVFGTQLASFGLSLGRYATSASTIDDAKIESIKRSGTALDELLIVMDKIPTTGGWKEKLVGSQNGQTFGAALTSMARGIESYCNTAATIDTSDITAITNSGTAITTLGTVLELIPESSETQKASELATAVDNLKKLSEKIDAISNAGYSYSGVYSLKGAVNNISTLLSEVDSKDLASKASTVKNVVTNYLDKVASTIQGWSESSFDGAESFKTAITNLVSMDLSNASAFSEAASSVSTGTASLITAMSTAIDSGASTVSDAMGSVVDSAVSAVSDKSGEFTEAGGELVDSLAEGINDEDGTVSSAGSTVAAGAVSGASSNINAMRQAGIYIAQGLINGMYVMKNAVYYKGYELGKAAADGVKNGADENSPSKLTYQYGVWVGEGLVNGMDVMGKTVYNSGISMGESAVSGVSKTIGRVADLVSSGIDAQPTIRPVMDLSDVTSGINAIGSMFNGSHTIGTTAHLRAISPMMNNRQNGASNEVVSAIKELRNDMSRMGNTYQINGITYDDGSNISGAVKALIRAAKVERRV